MNRTWWTLCLLLFLLLPGLAEPAGLARRFVLSAGANSGGHERVPLRYAVSDAIQFGEVMIKMGGVDTYDHLLLEEPNTDQFKRALEHIRDLVSVAQDRVGRTEFIFYYSGHADEEGLLLGENRLSYGQLRKMMDEIPADVRITVLDACASGAITRIKGGQRRQAFLVDDSSDTRGYAFLTSSSADEAAQESDQIGSSFFTHYLVSGMRGAADVSGDGKVSLTEAYEFAFDETLASTTETRGGAQHPSYEINLSGIGDVVMTDLREISAGILLTEEIQGRIFIRNEARQLVAELYKPMGRTIELGLEPGKYRVYISQEEALFLGTLSLDSGDRILVQQRNFQPTEREETVLRGARPGGAPLVKVDPRLLALARRIRLEFGMGVWTGGTKSEEIDGEGNVHASVTTVNLASGIGVSHWLRDDLSIGLRLGVVAADAQVVVGSDVRSEDLSVVELMFIGKRYRPGLGGSSPFLPYLAGGVGTFIATVSETRVGSEVSSLVSTQTAFGGYFGVGVDAPLSRRWMLGSEAGFSFVTDFDESVGGRKNYSGFKIGVSISFLLGKGVPPLS